MLHRGEFSILRDRDFAAYEAAGLSYDTKFDLRQTVDVPTEWFSVPPAAPHGQTPKLGAPKGIAEQQPRTYQGAGAYRKVNHRARLRRLCFEPDPPTQALVAASTCDDRVAH